MRALGPYVEFDTVDATRGGARDSAVAVQPTAGGMQALQKGLTVLQVEQILGPAARVTPRTEGSIEIIVREYSADRDRVSAKFVGGVLVDYTITPRR
jgi:hypothetical protein